MKSAAGIFNIFALVLLFASRVQADSNLRGARTLQSNGGQVTCVRITGVDGTVRTTFPCDSQTEAPIALEGEGEGDSGSTSDSTDNEPEVAGVDGDSDSTDNEQEVAGVDGDNDSPDEDDEEDDEESEMP